MKDKFKSFIENLFMSTEEKPEVVEVELAPETTIEEVKEVIEEVAEVLLEEVNKDVSYSKTEVDQMIEGVIESLSEKIMMSKQVKEDLEARILLMETELKRPGKAPENITPPVKETRDSDSWSMAKEIKNNLK